MGPISGIPEDFDAFWADVQDEAQRAPLDVQRSLRNDFEAPGFVVETLRFRGSAGWLNGWIATPPGARRLPGFLWLAPYGRESKLPDRYGTRTGMVSLSFNFHGEGAFHQEAYVRERGYFAEGAESPETWIFRRMAVDAMIAARVLQAQVEVDEDRIAAMGMSQGGGMAIWLGAWSPVVKSVVADMPFLGNVRSTLANHVHRYPIKELSDYMEQIPLGHERVGNTLSYFDTVHQASRCAKPTHVSLGQKDPACRPDTVRAIFEALPGEKELRVYDWGHDWHPEMVEANRAWLDRTLGR